MSMDILARHRSDRSAKDAQALRDRMDEFGHTNVEYDTRRGHFRGTCEFGCTGILIDGVHSYGTGLSPCPGPKAPDA